MSKKSNGITPEIYRKGTVGALIIAFVAMVVWIIVFRAGFFAPALGVLVPIALKKGYEYATDGSSAFKRQRFLVILSFAVAVVATLGGYWIQGAALYDVPFLAVPVILWKAFTAETSYGTVFLVYFGVGLFATLIGVLAFLRKPKEQ